MAKSKVNVSKAGGGILVREARKMFRYTKVDPKRPARNTEYRRPGDWNGPRHPDGKPKTYRDADGNVHVAPGDKRPYLDPRSRPSFRKGVSEKVWNRAKGRDGKVRDPNTLDEIGWKPGQSRRDVWDMGHVPGEKYHDKWQDYLDGKMTPKEFREWYNDPANYQVELPGNNRSHRFE